MGVLYAFLVLYVDNIQLIANDIPAFQDVKSWLRICFSIKDLRVATYILQIKFYRDRSKHLIELSQSTYLDQILRRFNMSNSKKGEIPMNHTIKLSKTQCPNSDDEIDRMSRVPCNILNFCNTLFLHVFFISIVGCKRID